MINKEIRNIIEKHKFIRVTNPINALKHLKKGHNIVWDERISEEDIRKDEKERIIKKIGGMFFPNEHQLECQKVIIQKLNEEDKTAHKKVQGR